MNSLLTSNIDVYVTGSNSKFLSSDIVTEFRGRGDEIRIYPSFAEFTLFIMVTATMHGRLHDLWWIACGRRSSERTTESRPPKNIFAKCISEGRYRA